MDDPRFTRDVIRAHLKNHPVPQRLLARELKVSHSWLSKFCLSRIDSPRLETLSRLARWVETDRKQKRA
jgi:transcriptional regulator with XRE-family HTH domain